jgi:hypothetical protein
MAATKKGPVAGVKEALANWSTLNEFLRECTEDQAAAALKAEKAGKARLQYLLRIHARFNKCRADRERSELLTA